MTSIGSMISPVLKQTLMGAVKLNESASEWEERILNEPDEVRVTLINDVEYDVRGEAMTQTTCADCPASLLVEVAPKGVDLDLLCSKPRVAVCVPCGQKRVADKRGTLIHTKPQEAPVEIDLSTYSEAELAQLAIQARARMVAEAEALIPAKRTKAQKAEAKRIAKDQALMEEQRKANRNLALPDVTITVKGQTRFVPALDLHDVGNDLNVETSPKMRSAYNKALFALGMDLLPKDATYVAVVEAHKALLEHGQPVEALATVVEPDAKAKVDPKVKAFAEVMGISEKKARKRLEKVGVL